MDISNLYSILNLKQLMHCTKENLTLKNSYEMIQELKIELK